MFGKLISTKCLLAGKELMRHKYKLPDCLLQEKSRFFLGSYSTNIRDESLKKGYHRPGDNLIFF
jgi:hypothetical protein